MIHRLRGVMLILPLMAAQAAHSAEPGDAYHLLVRDDTGHTLRLRLRIESGGRVLQMDAAPATRPHDELLSRALVAALDRNRDGKLTKEELQAADKTLLEAFDVDEDECITPFELVPSLLSEASPPTMRSTPQLTLSLPGQDIGAKPDREIVFRMDESRPERTRIRAGRWILDIDTQPSLPPAVPKRSARNEKNAATDPARPRLNAFQREAADSIMSLIVSPRPRSWFAILDADGDGQLSARELRAAWERLADAEARKAGFVTAPEENGSYLTLTFVRGTGGVRGIPLRKRPVSRRGPDWFQAMDRNGDGCVSPREWIGTGEQFRRLDRDGDGLLGPEEAEAPR